MATTNSASYSLEAAGAPVATSDLAELLLGFSGIMIVLWLPTREQLIFGPIAMLAPLVMVLRRHATRNELGIDWRGFVSAWWVLPAALTFAALSIGLARIAGTFHAPYNTDLAHAGGYVLWTIYQQFLLQDYFMPRLTRILSSDGAIAASSVLFAVAHLPNVPLALATLVWGAVSCLLFRRYHNLYVVGLAQGLLGLCFAACIPEAMHHHMRVGLGYFQYRQ